MVGLEEKGHSFCFCNVLYMPEFDCPAEYIDKRADVSEYCSFSILFCISLNVKRFRLWKYFATAFEACM